MGQLTATEPAGWAIQIRTRGGWLLHSTYTDEVAARLRAARLNKSETQTYRLVRLLAEEVQL